ncbi:DUF3822 family protein [Confluentibacter sediminis]|uniref:DUF3822 family protein n=1 Tax=Confluentibacter sediminis TaxID=2219045 RepID=UPI000DAD7D1D|nr:DUF3822 family protein [Confluentibacter sediminis]
MAITSNSYNIPSKQALSIQISLSGLSFCILQRDLKTISVLRNYTFEKKLNHHEVLDKLKQLFNTESFLLSHFDSVHVIHSNELSTLVPKALFDENSLADYLKFNSKILKSDFIAYDTIDINDSVNVYIPYVNINNFIYDVFGAFTYKHISTILMEQILVIEKNATNTKVYINVNSNHFEMIVIDKSKLLLYNTFEYTTKEDFIYYILFTTEQLQLNPELFELIFIGDIDSKDELYAMAYKYVQFVFFGKRQDHYKYSLDAQPKSNHSNFTILNSF